MKSKTLKKFSILPLLLPTLVASNNCFAQASGASLGESRETISKYEILGVKLGMSEQQARITLASYRPSINPKQLDFAGKPLKLDVSDINLNNPTDGKKVKAGFQIAYKGVGVDGAYDFVKVFTYNGKVWAIWRWDAAGRYEYSEAKNNLLGKYPNGNPIITSVVRVVNNTPSTSEGQDVGGVELYDGSCQYPPFRQAVTGDSINLERGCNMFFKVNYRISSYSGVRQLNFGESILADIGVGREFFLQMRGLARKDAVIQKDSLQKSSF